MKLRSLLFPSLLLLAALPTLAADFSMRLLDAQGVAAESIGVVHAEPSPYGVVLRPELKGLPPGLHGFHLHVNPDCGASVQDGRTIPAGKAGGHFDPAGTGRHEGPWGSGHLGDLPALYVDEQGRASEPVLAPRLRMADLAGHALIIHIGGDNHADHPAPLGGGGARLACGLIEP